MSHPEKNWQSLVQYVLDCKTKRKEVAEDKIPLFWPHMWQTKSQVVQQWQDQAMSHKQVHIETRKTNLGAATAEEKKDAEICGFRGDCKTKWHHQ